jgi:hypothetical protein
MKDADANIVCRTNAGSDDRKNDIGSVNEDEEQVVEMGQDRDILEDLEREGRRGDNSSSDASWQDGVSRLSGNGNISSNISQSHAEQQRQLCPTNLMLLWDSTQEWFHRLTQWQRAATPLAFVLSHQPLS